MGRNSKIGVSSALFWIPFIKDHPGVGVGHSITACVTKTDQILMNPAVVMDSIFTAAASGASISMTCHSLATITPIEHRISTNVASCRDESLYFKRVKGSMKRPTHPVMGPVSRANYGQGFHQTSTMDMKSANTFRPGWQIALLLALFALMNPCCQRYPPLTRHPVMTIQRSSIPPIISTNSFPCRPMTCSVAFPASIRHYAAVGWQRPGIGSWRNPD